MKDVIIQVDAKKKELVKEIKKVLETYEYTESFADDFSYNTVDRREDIIKLHIFSISSVNDTTEVLNEDLQKRVLRYLTISSVVKMDEVDGIKEGVNVDYENIMNNKEFVYSDFYEAMMSNKEEGFNLPLDLRDKLYNKRQFGIKKYGDKSFQNSFEASMTSPIREHAMEELIDELNYLFHLHFVLSVKADISYAVEIEKISKSIGLIKQVYSTLSELQSV